MPKVTALKGPRTPQPGQTRFIEERKMMFDGQEVSILKTSYEDDDHTQTYRTPPSDPRDEEIKELWSRVNELEKDRAHDVAISRVLAAVSICSLVFTLLCLTGVIAR